MLQVKIIYNKRLKETKHLIDKEVHLNNEIDCDTYKDNILLKDRALIIKLFSSHINNSYLSLPKFYLYIPILDRYLGKNKNGKMMYVLKDEAIAFKFGLCEKTHNLLQINLRATDEDLYLTYHPSTHEISLCDDHDNQSMYHICHHPKGSFSLQTYKYNYCNYVCLYRKRLILMSNPLHCCSFVPIPVVVI